MNYIKVFEHFENDMLYKQISRISFDSLDKNVLEQVREEEIKRVQEKYPEHWLEIIRDKKLNQLGI
jgi:hypothetical protein